MIPKLYETIEQQIAQGARPQDLEPSLVALGWPRPLVSEAVNAWLNAHGRLMQKTNFKDWLKKYQRRALPATVLLVFVSVLSSSVLLLQPWPTKILVDSGFGNIKAPGPLAAYTHKPELILFTSLLTIIVFLLGIFFGTIRDYLVLRLGFWLNRDIKEESLRHILNLPLFHQERLAKGDYLYRQNTLTNSLSDLVLDTTSLIAESVIMVLGIFVIMMTINAKLTLISVVLVPFIFILIRLFGPKLGRISQQITQNASQTSAIVAESIDNAETLQAFTLEEKQIQKADNLWRCNYRLSRSRLFWGRGYRFVNSLLIILGTSAVMYFGGTDALNGSMTLGQLLIFMTYMGYLLGPIEAIATEIAVRNQKIVDVSRVYEVLTDHENVESLRQDNHLPFTRGRIEFQNVSYSYDHTPVLQSVNLVVEPAQKIAIIGPSGGGKTTLMKLLPLFVEPSAGRVLIDGIDVQTVSLKELRQHIVWISQTPQLFNGSIEENLRDGNTNYQFTPQEIEAATNAANVKEFTDRLPDGLNTNAGENGSGLSGGQRQRIAIARGLLKNAPIVCMDEPTAALDSKSENTIKESISRLIDGKTVIMVTHRKALLSLMDKIYVMDGGILHTVDEFGGLDAYLQKISDSEANVAQVADEARRKAEAEAKLISLQEENLALQERLAQAAQEPLTATSDVTISINH